MKSGVCPKCESHEVYMAKGGSSIRSITVTITMWSMAPVILYVCTHCGHLELYLPKGEVLAAIQQKWDKVT